MKRIPLFQRCCSSVLLLLVAACATDRQVIQQADTTHKQLEPAVLQDAQLKNYLKSMGERIVDAAEALDREGQGPEKHFEKGEKNDWMFSKEEFHLVNSKTLNAFTTGGEHMYIFAELMKQCHSEDELAAVMAHEYGHVYSRHVQKGMDRQTATLVTALGAGVAGYAIGGKKHGSEYAQYGLIGGALAAQFLNLGYTREDEAEADKWGFNFYTRAGWDPDHFSDFFQQLIDKGHDKTPEQLSDHPSLVSRVEASKNRAAAISPEDRARWSRPPVANSSRFAALKLRAEEVGRSLPTDEQLTKAQILLTALPSCLLPEDPPETKESREVLAELYAESSAKKPAPK